jgi:large subunit ribosomal protein L4
MEIPIYNIAGEVIDRLEVDQAALGGEPNKALMRQAVIMYEANRRVGTAKAKNRGELQGTDHKVWKQKHTGRARAGSRNSPVWVHGGAAHAVRPRDYRKKMNTFSRRQALYSAFLAKVLDGEVLAVKGLELPEAKTKAMATILKNLGAERSFLIVLPDTNAELWRCTRNIPLATMMAWKDLNAYVMIRPNRVIFDLEAIKPFLDAAPRSGESEEAAEEQVGGEAR